MKNAKKVLAMVIVLALAISMAIPAMAYEHAAPQNSTLTISGKAGTTYTIYEMAKLTQSADGEAFAYEILPAWKNFFADVEVEREENMVKAFSIDSQNNILTEVVEISDEEMVAIAEAALAYAEDHADDVDPNTKITATTTATIASGNTSVTVQLPTAYYLVASSMGTRVIVDTLENADQDQDNVIEEKNEAPTIEKYVGATEGEELKAVDVAFTETAYYTIKVKVKTGAEGYYVVDELPDGVIYDEDSAEISAGDFESVTYDEEDNILTFVIDGEENLVNQTLEITYTATVTDAANVINANVNTAELFCGEAEISAGTDSATVYTWELQLIKFEDDDNNGTNTLLPGATFVLKEDGKYLTFAKDGDVYTYTGVSNTLVDAAKLTSATGKYTIKGLDSSAYALEEILAPAGYNAVVGDMTVTITGNYAQDNLTMTQSVGEYNYDQATDKDGVDAQNKDAFGVLNQTGVELPSTGGTGTVIFIAVGSFLVMAMGVLLVVRKRMSKVVYTR